MSDFSFMEQALHDTLSAIGPEAMDSLVLVGGWLPFLYSNFLWKLPTPGFPQTTDIDIGVLDTGPKPIGETLFTRLQRAGLALERVYEGEDHPVEFVHRTGPVGVKVEFLASFHTSDDTRHRLLGRELDWSRIEGLEVVLTRPLRLTITVLGRDFAVQVPRPGAYFFHKGVVFATRPDENKKWKDLYTLYWGLRFCPSRPALVDEILGEKDGEGFEVFQDSLREAVGSTRGEGYIKLRPLLRPWLPEPDITSDLKSTFAPLLERIG